MPNFVSIELNDASMLVACAKSAGRRFQINQLFEIATGESSDTAIGEQLKSALADRGITRFELIAVVHRQQVEMREVVVPPAPPNEVPDLVRFQARNVFATMNENWSLDYVPFDEPSETEQTRVLAVAVAPSVIERYESIATAAGTKLKRLLFRPYVFCDLLENRLSDGKNRLLIDPNDLQYDLSVSVGCKLIATRSITASDHVDRDGVADQVVGAVKRTIASTRSALDGTIDQIIVGGSQEEFSAVQDLLTERIDIPVVFADPFKSVSPSTLTAPRPEHPEQYSALIGSLIRECSEQQQHIDFVNPRKPVVKKRDYRKLLIGAGAAAVLLLGLLAFSWFTLSNQSKQIAELDEKLQNLQDENSGKANNQSSLDKIIGEVEKLDQWQMTDVNWLDQLATISDLLLTPDDIIVSSFRGTPLPKGDGVRIDLTTRMTENTSRETEWKQNLFKHFDDVRFGDTVVDDEESDYPVVHNISLFKLNSIEETVEKYNAIAAEAQKKSLETQFTPTSGSE